MGGNPARTKICVVRKNERDGNRVGFDIASATTTLIESPDIRKPQGRAEEKFTMRIGMQLGDVLEAPTSAKYWTANRARATIW